MRALILLLVCLSASADVVAVKGGKKIKGKVVSEGVEVVVNTFNSTHKEMTLGVHRVPKDKVKRITRTLPAPHHEFNGRVAAIERAAGKKEETFEEPDWGDEPVKEDVGPAAQQYLELAEWCAQHKLKGQRLLALELALRHDPKNEAARKALGSKAPKGDWQAQVELARRFLAAEEDADRAAALAEIRRDRAFPFAGLYLQRAWRSVRQPGGYQKDRPVALLADKLKENARYTLYVPKSYDALRPTPLIIGLHGGGAGGAKGDLVVGTGWQAMNFYRGQCERRGWICACPTALRAGWRGENDEWIDTVLDEVGALYNIDENRIYLVGHSMGGGGTWAQGSRIPEVWAAIAPAASFGVTGLGQFDKTKTGFYVYHSDDDPRTGVMGVRPRMLNLPGSGIDFVYTELSGRGHSFPTEVINDIFDFFALRTLARRGKPQARPQSSFLRKVSRDEKKYLPALKQAGGADDGAKLSHLLKKLATGGGVAEQAVEPLTRSTDPKASASVAKLMLKAKSGPDVRKYAARILGARKATGELKALGRALLIEEESNALLEMLAAIGEIGDASAGPSVLRFLKKRGEFLASRTRGGLLSHSDWETIIPTLARACDLVGSFKPDKGAAGIESVVFDGVLLSATKVRYDIQNQRPQPYAEALATASCGAMGKLGGANAVAALMKVRKAGEGAAGATIKRLRGPVADIGDWAREPSVQAAVNEALSGLRE